MTFPRFWPWIRNALAVVGGAALVSVAWFYAVLWYEARPVPALARATPASPVAERLAARIAPGLQAAAADYESEFLSHAAEHGVLVRYAASRAYPVVVREIPRGAEIATDHLLSEFGKFTLSDVAAAIVDHARAKGERPHPSFRGRDSVPFERRRLDRPL